jgi:asparagine synthase (glutamine-hydrolysing)
MSLILALWNRTGEPVDETILRSMLDSTSNLQNDGEGLWRHTEIALAHQHFWVTPEEVDRPQPSVDPATGCALTCSARLDNRPELIHALGLEAVPANSLSDADLILSAYRRWGRDCPSHLLGDFAFVLWDQAEGRLFAARDALGCQDLHYLLTPSHCMLATRITSLLDHPSVQPRLNEKKIAEYLALQWGDDVNTYYDGILHLPPAHCLEVTRDSSRLWRYWEVDPGKTIHYARQEEYGEHYRELIKESLRARLRSAYPVGLSLSGGLDSTSLACLASEVLAESGAPAGALGTYSYVFDEFPECDERAYIQPVLEQAARSHPIRSRIINGDALWPRPLEADWPVGRDHPGQDPYYYLVQATLQAAHQDGVRVMLSGFYGDDLYSGSEYLFADLLRSRQFRMALRLLSRYRRFIDPQRNLLEYGLRPLLPATLKKAYRKFRPKPLEWQAWIPAALAERAGLDENGTLQPDAVRYTLPGQQRRFAALSAQGYPESFSGYQIAARDSGMEYAFPYADRRIVAFVLGLPPEQVSLPRIQRRILREALKGRLPETVRQRLDKTVFSPLFNRGFYEKSFPAVVSAFQHSQVLERGLVRADWLAQELERTSQTHEGHILWQVLCVETWLQKVG